MDAPGLRGKYAHNVADIPVLVGVGRSKIYAAINDGTLVARKLGKRTLILDEDLKKWLFALPLTRGGDDE